MEKATLRAFENSLTPTAATFEAVPVPNIALLKTRAFFVAVSIPLLNGAIHFPMPSLVLICLLMVSIPFNMF